MKLKVLLGALLAALAGGSLASSASALSTTDIVPLQTMSTFALEEDDESGALWVGKNLFYFGNNIAVDEDVNGLSFLFGNQLELSGRSEYSFVAGNSINYSGTTHKDLFIAGNAITIDEKADVGRDAFAAGNSIVLKSDLLGDFSATAQKVTFKNVTIAGDVNLAVAEAVFDGEVAIDGKLIINEDAEITGLDNATYTALEKYEEIKDETTVTEIVIAKIISLVGLFITFAVLLALFPGLNERITREVSGTQFVKDLAIGCCTVFFLAIIIIFLLISFLGAPLGLILFITYIIMIYLSQAFTGFWLGKLIFRNALNLKVNAFLEAFVGIVILTLLVCLPYFGGLIWILAMILGFGLIMQSINARSRKQNPQHVYKYTNDQEVKSVAEGETITTSSESKSKTSSKTDNTNKSTKAKTDSKSEKTKKDKDAKSAE